MRHDDTVPESSRVVNGLLARQLCRMSIQAGMRHRVSHLEFQQKGTSL